MPRSASGGTSLFGLMTFEYGEMVTGRRHP
jgi:hypothetical protein